MHYTPPQFKGTYTKLRAHKPIQALCRSLRRQFSEGKSYTRANSKNKHKLTSKKSFREVEEMKLKQNLWYQFKTNGTETDKYNDLDLEFISS
jgi:hypothetical protein